MQEFRRFDPFPKSSTLQSRHQHHLAKVNEQLAHKSRRKKQRTYENKKQQANVSSGGGGGGGWDRVRSTEYRVVYIMHCVGPCYVMHMVLQTFEL